MKKETEIYYRNGVDAVLVENYFGDTRNCVQALDYLHKNMPDKLYGINILGDYRTAFELAEKYGADFVQIDSVCGHLSPGAGVTADNVCEKLLFADGVIIVSSLKDGHHDYGDVCEAYLKGFMDRVREFHT